MTGNGGNFKESFKVAFHPELSVAYFLTILLCNQLIINSLCLKIIKICNIILSYLEENEKSSQAQ